MFNRSLIQNRKITLSALLQTLNTSRALHTLSNHIIELDVNHAILNQAVSFHNCLFIFPQTSSHSCTVITSTEGIRIEDSRLEASICIWGELRQTNALGYLGQDGPNVFIERCEFDQFQVNIGGVQANSQPSIQLSGLINHCRIICTEPLRVSFLQCKFFLVELLGHCNQLQISETVGRELNFSNFRAKFMWFQRPLVMQVQKIEIDEQTISHLAEEARAQNYPVHFAQVAKLIMDVFRANRSGSKFLKANDILCSSLKLKRPNVIKNFIIYGLFKNFYSIWRMLIFCLFTIAVFGILFYCLVPANHPNQSFVDWLYFSAVTFTTLGYGDISPKGALCLLAPIEAFIGIISVIITSWIFSRQFNDY